MCVCGFVCVFLKESRNTSSFALSLDSPAVKTVVQEEDCALAQQHISVVTTVMCQCGTGMLVQVCQCGTAVKVRLLLHLFPD